MYGTQQAHAYCIWLKLYVYNAIQNQADFLPENVNWWVCECVCVIHFWISLSVY